MTESSGRADAETKWARGLLGISRVALADFNKKTGKDYAYREMYDPEKNAEVGVEYFRDLVEYWARRLGVEIDGQDIDTIARIAYAFVL